MSLYYHPHVSLGFDTLPPCEPIGDQRLSYSIAPNTRCSSAIRPGCRYSPLGTLAAVIRIAYAAPLAVWVVVCHAFIPNRHQFLELGLHSWKFGRGSVALYEDVAGWAELGRFHVFANVEHDIPGGPARRDVLARAGTHL